MPDAPTDTPVNGWRRRMRVWLDRYPSRVTLVFLTGAVYWATLAALLGVQLTLLTWVNSLTLSVVLAAAFTSARRTDAPKARLFTGVLAAVLLVAAVLIGGVDLWYSFGVAAASCLAFEVAVARIHREDRRMEQLALRAWLANIDSAGTDDRVELDVRPYRCGRCARIHHAGFAPGARMLLPDMFKVTFDYPMARRVVFHLAHATDTSDGLWLIGVPPDFEALQWSGRYSV